MKTLIAFLISLPLWAQVDFPNPIRSGGTLPATCRPGSLVPALFVLTSGTPVTSAQTYQCTAANTWTAIPTSGGGGASPAGSTGQKQIYGTSSTFLGVATDIQAEAFGCIGDNATDNSTCITNALAALNTAGGGTLHFGAGTFQVLSQITLPNYTGGTPASHYPLRVTGQGAGFSWNNQSAAATTLDLRYSGTGGQILATGQGPFELDHLKLLNGATAGSNNTPFVWVTNTQLYAHDLYIRGNPTTPGASSTQDVFILGGTTGTGPDNTINSQFTGFGTIIEKVWFDKIERAVLIQHINGGVAWITLRDLGIDSTAGSSLGSGACIDILANSNGIFISQINIGGAYPYGIRDQGGLNSFVSNSFSDECCTTAFYRLEGAATLASASGSNSTTPVSETNPNLTISSSGSLPIINSGSKIKIGSVVSGNQFLWLGQYGPNNFAGIWGPLTTPGSTNYSFLADNNGTTYLNSASGQNISVRNANDEQFNVSSAGTTFVTNALLATKVTKYQNISTVGPGLAPIYGRISSTGNAAAISPATLCAAAVCTGGQYIVHAYLASTVTCATPGLGKVALELTWTDDAGTKTSQVVPLTVSSALSLSASMPLGDTVSYASGDFPLFSSGANPINYDTTYTVCTSGTGTYSLRISVEQLL